MTRVALKDSGEEEFSQWAELKVVHSPILLMYKRKWSKVQIVRLLGGGQLSVA